VPTGNSWDPEAVEAQPTGGAWPVASVNAVTPGLKYPSCIPTTTKVYITVTVTPTAAESIWKRGAVFTPGLPDYTDTNPSAIFTTTKYVFLMPVIRTVEHASQFPCIEMVFDFAIISHELA
jgi:hypothetical protein